MQLAFSGYALSCNEALRAKSNEPEELQAAPGLRSQRVAFVTGAARGIGAAIVREFLQKGMCVAMMDVDPPDPDYFGDWITHPSFLPIKGDVTNKTDLTQALEQTDQKWGRLHALIANAGVHFIASLLETTETEFDRLMAVNLKGTFFTLQLGVPHLLKTGQSGAIVLMGSDQSVIGRRDTFAYGASKGAVAQMAKSLAQELGPLGLRINALCPATTETDLSRKAFDAVAKRAFSGDVGRCRQESLNAYPLGRFGTPEEMAKAAYFLISPDSAYMTGQLLCVDGGLTCG